MDIVVTGSDFVGIEDVNNSAKEAFLNKELATS